MTGYPDDILRIRIPTGNVHVLRDEDGLYLLDTGMVGARTLLRWGLRRAGWEDLPLRGIILTHGHLDHSFNAARLSEETGAWIAAPRGDRRLIEGDFGCDGWGRVGAWLQIVGSWALRYRVPDAVRWFEPGDVLGCYGGLEVVPLPGHTAGHVGFVSRRHNLLFSSDLFASPGWWWPHLPPAIFNEDRAGLLASVDRALGLGVAGVIPNHGERATPERHLARLRRIRAGVGAVRGDSPRGSR